MKWMSFEFFTSIKLVVTAGRYAEYNLNLKWHSGTTFRHVVPADPTAWHYEIEEARENSRDATGKYVLPTYFKIEKGSTLTTQDVKAKAFILRRVKAIHARRLKVCTDCGGFAAPGTGCPRCLEQWNEERERVAAAAENEGMPTP